MKVIVEIIHEITNLKDIFLLDVDPGRDTNRTVVTFAGDPDSVVDAAFNAIKKASEVIDMSVHKGNHPRMGATDVCPLIPIQGVTKEDCVKYAKKLGARVGGELKIPVYYYGDAAANPNRVKLPDIREGEYEGLREKLKKPEFKPDEGPAVFNEKIGATVIGVRDFMLAYNVNLDSNDISIAKEIAQVIRESGQILRDSKGAIIRDENKTAKRKPGRLKYCQAGGWYIKEYGYAQVTMNLHKFSITGLHTAFDAIKEEAARFKIALRGSELIGIVPKQAIIDSGIYYLKKEGLNIDIPDKMVIKKAVDSLGLNSVKPFIPEEKIIEYAISHKKKKSLVDLSVNKFVDELSSSSPAPGGGSVAALNGVLSAALTSMVACVTLSNKKYIDNKTIMQDISNRTQKLKKSCLELVDKDTEAFNLFMHALRMPKDTEIEKKERAKAIMEAAKNASEVPFQVLSHSLTLLEIIEKCAYSGNPNALSDTAVSAIQAEAAAEGALLNIRINLPAINDKEYTDKIIKKADDIIKKVRKLKKEIITYIEEELQYS